MAIKQCLLTGCTGFIGRHILQALLNRDIAVRGLTRMSPDEASGVLPDKVDIFHGNLAIPSSLQGVAAGIDTVIHAAGYAHALGSNTELHRKTTIDGTRNLLAAAEKHGA